MKEKYNLDTIKNVFIKRHQKDQKVGHIGEKIIAIHISSKELLQIPQEKADNPI